MAEAPGRAGVQERDAAALLQVLDVGMAEERKPRARVLCRARKRGQIALDAVEMAWVTKMRTPSSSSVRLCGTVGA